MKIVFLLLLLTHFSYALWVENIEVKVIDQKGRGIPNALIEIEYQFKDYYSYDGKIEGYTDENGVFQRKLLNLVPEDMEKRDYKMKVRYAFLEELIEVKCVEKGTACSEEQPKKLTITLPVGMLQVIIFDSKGLPMEGVDVKCLSKKFLDFQLTDNTDKNGYAVFHIPISDYEIKAVYGEIEEEMSISMKGDRRISMTIPTYDLKVKVVDENGRGLEGDVMVNDESKKAINGGAEFPRLPYKEVSLLVRYKNFSTEKKISMGRDIVETVVFDMSPPDIISMYTTPPIGGEPTKVYANIVDFGKYTSGIKDVKLKYLINNTWKSTSMGSPRKEIFTASIPGLPPKTEVRYIIEAVDNNNNINSREGSYIVGEAKGSGREGSGFSFPDINIWWVLIPILVILIFLAGLYIYFKITER